MINVMVIGLPGDMATIATKRILKEQNLSLIPYSITGNDIDDEKIVINNIEIELIKANEIEKKNTIINKLKPFIAIDFTEPNAVHKNIEYYCRSDISFIMGTTGVVVNRIKQNIEESNICAVIAPNMGKQIVALQAMFEFAAENFPKCFTGYSLQITESHQQNKLDTSGTARSMINYFNTLGLKFDETMIEKIRDQNTQRTIGVPEKYLDGHAWHNYKLTSEDKSVFIQLKHNINGREIYAEGTISSIYYLDNKIKNGESGKIFSMIDVMKIA